MIVILYFQTENETLNGGFLGSWIDEGRSKVR